MEEKITKERIVSLIREEFERLHLTIQSIRKDRLTQPGVEGEWSVKDTMSHLSAWRRLLIQWTNDSLAGKIPDRPGPDESWDGLDELNQSLYLANRNLPLDEVLNEFTAAYKDSLVLIESLTADDLLKPDQFGWRKGDPLWHMVAGNTWLHDKEHHETLRRWLSQKE